MTLKLSQRSDIPPFRALDILRMVNERIADGEDIVHLEAGQPCFGAPEAALEHAVSVLKSDPKQGYTEALGMKLLRDRIAVFYRDTYGVDLDHNNIAVTIGASGAFLLGWLAVFDIGDKVAIAAPGYAAYRNILKSLGLDVVELAVGEDTNYQPYVSELEKIEGDIDGLIIASPSNPTGTVIPPDELKAIVAWCEKKSVRLVADELYQRVTYDTEADTVLRYTDQALVVNSFSKYFALTGWRLGWLVMPDDVAPRVKALAESLFVSPPTLAQHVAYKVFDHTDVLDGYVAHYKKNLDILRAELPKAGFTKMANTQGAFYIYADVSDFTNDSEAFCRRMIDEAGVATTPGIDFDLVHGNQTIRICFAGPEADIREACRRLQAWDKA